ncbi:MAG: hypothetical protein A2Z70_00505 [Chloroflexi bacterium RBG_13_48_17]|nr:MAG: hypothetical protein A2Z70_00505 [Chloroflexi bacterium RBG_13_48_17]
MNIVAMSVLVAMMLLTVSDVFLRYVFKKPILDSISLTEYMMVCGVFLALAWCEVNGKHVTVDIVVSRFSPKIQTIFSIGTYFVELGLCSLITWQSFLETLAIRQLQKASLLLGVPVYPFYFILTFGFALFSLVMLTRFIYYLYEAVKR